MANTEKRRKEVFSVCMGGLCLGTRVVWPGMWPQPRRDEKEREAFFFFVFTFTFTSFGEMGGWVSP